MAKYKKGSKATKKQPSVKTKNATRTAIKRFEEDRGRRWKKRIKQKNERNRKKTNYAQGVSFST
jgi:hypothetical protein